MKIYLAGGMRSGWQDRLSEFDVIDPRTHGLSDPEEYTAWDMAGVRECDIVFAYLEKSNPSGLGMAFEIGYALGLGKRVIFVNEKKDKYAKILECACINFDTLEEGIKYLETYC